MRIQGILSSPFVALTPSLISRCGPPFVICAKNSGLCKSGECGSGQNTLFTDCCLDSKHYDVKISGCEQQ